MELGFGLVWMDRRRGRDGTASCLMVCRLDEGFRGYLNAM